MPVFGELLWSVMAVSAAGGVLLQTMPEKSRIAPYIRFLLSLVLLLMLLSPLAGLFADLNISDPTTLLAQTGYEGTGGKVYGDIVTEEAVSRASASLAALISAETGIAVSDMAVALTTVRTEGDDGIEITVTGVEVTLFGRAHAIAAEKISALVRRTLYCPCTVGTKEAGNA